MKILTRGNAKILKDGMRTCFPLVAITKKKGEPY